MQELLFSIPVKVPRVEHLEYPDFQPAGDGGGLGELAVHGDRVRLVHQHLLVRVQVVKVETLWRMELLRTSGIFSPSFNLYILSQAKLPHFEVVPPKHIIKVKLIMIYNYYEIINLHLPLYNLVDPYGHDSLQELQG